MLESDPDQREYAALLFRKKIFEEELAKINREITRFRFGIKKEPLPTSIVIMRATDEPTMPLYRAWDGWEEL